MIKFLILFVLVAAAFAQYPYDNQIHWWDTDDNKADIKGETRAVPFPQCLISGSRSKFLQSSSLQKAFDAALRDEEQYAKREYYENTKKKNYDRMDDYDYNDYDDDGRRPGYGKNLAAAAAIKLTRSLMTKLACDLNDTTSEALEDFLNKFTVSDKLCSARSKVDCSTKSLYRMPSGLCNNLDEPFLGNSHTAFGRLYSANYEDYVAEPRSRSVRGGPLPSCRKISLELGSKPIFNRVFNNHFTIFGQYIAHDIALSVPVTDTYSTPISSCTCDSKYSKSKCTVIDIPDDDPTLGGQKCMAFPATAQAFKDEVCSLGVKEQLNGNTHFIDLSGLYGSTVRMSQALRYEGAHLKSTRRYGSRILPPSQREGKSCSDETKKYKCFAGGDSRLMINTLFTGIQTTFLRAHNDLVTLINKVHPALQDTEVFEGVKGMLTGYFQRVTYADWLPILLGTRYRDDYNIFTLFRPTTYSSEVKPVVFNEVATAAFRLHTLVRDLFSRCTPDGSRIDQLWLHDISNKAKYAYDIENYGVDSILCGSFYDYGFTFDGNFAHQIHHRLFETTNSYGQLWRNDLVAINICRGREHGVQSFLKVWQNCTGKKAYDFKDFGYTINYSGIKLLKKLYKSIHDIDLFVGLNLEDTLPGALVGPTTSCILKKQFDALKFGDRFFYSHAINPNINMYNPFCSLALRLYPYRCFVCSTADIQSVPYNAFKPPSSQNPLTTCDQCRLSFSEYVAKICWDSVNLRNEPVLVSFLVELLIEHVLDFLGLVYDRSLTGTEIIQLVIAQAQTNPGEIVRLIVTVLYNLFKAADEQGGVPVAPGSGLLPGTFSVNTEGTSDAATDLTNFENLLPAKVQDMIQVTNQNVKDILTQPEPPKDE